MAGKTFEEMLDEGYADAWRPANAGDKLVGFVTNLSIGTSDYGRYPIVEVTREDGTRAAFHAFHEVARSALIDARPSMGERIGIVFNGKRLPKSVDPKAKDAESKKYHDYRVMLDRPAADMWADLSTTSDDDE